MSGKDDVSDPLCRGSIGYFCIKQCSVFASLFFAHTHIHNTPTYSLIPCSHCAAAID
jgi:hypothetical protein